MAQKIVFNYNQMSNSVTTLNSCADDYQNAADTLNTAMSALLEGGNWTGASKDAFEKLWTGSVYKHIHQAIPDAVRGLASVLQNNINTMQQADSQIAGSIPDSL